MRWLLLAMALLGYAPSAVAHRLDEYLQATTIAVARDQVDLRLTLTPGVDVAETVVAAIDRNGDGQISSAEQAAYARAIQDDLTLAIDGRAQPLRIVGASFPPVAAIRQGVGVIVIGFTTAPLPPGTHRLTLHNAYSGGDAVYLVNTLLPGDPGIAVLGQQRSFDQSRYQLDIATSATPANRATTSAQSLGREDRLSVVTTYGWHGIWHILQGYDHLLFVAGLVLGAATLWDLVKVITAFTLAHSITLTLAALGLVHAPEAIVEPLIALSIIAVAVQNILWADRAKGTSRLLLAFLFGLVHGLGFASGLLDIMQHMPRETMLLAILGFSLGVEAGNQMVLLPLFAAMRLLDRRWRMAPGRVSPDGVRRVGSMAIVVAGCCYLALDLWFD